MIQTLPDLLLWLNQPQALQSGRCERTYSLRMLRGFADESYRGLHCYRQVDIPKKNGGFRRLCIPRSDLKALQRRLLPLFLPAQNSLPASAFAYRCQKTLRQHAACHAGCSLLVKLDLCSFFDSVSFGAVFRAVDDALRLSPLVAAAVPAQSGDVISVAQTGRAAQGTPCWYNRQLSWYIAQFCTRQGSLPQGAPTSPLLSNLVFAGSPHRSLLSSKRHYLHPLCRRPHLFFLCGSTRHCRFGCSVPDRLCTFPAASQRLPAERRKNRSRRRRPPSCRNRGCGSRNPASSGILPKKAAAGNLLYRQIWAA